MNSASHPCPGRRPARAPGGDSPEGPSHPAGFERCNLNATLGILGIFVLGVFLTWFLIAELRVPLPADPARRKLATTLLQAAAIIAMPYAWAWARLDLSPARLGMNRRRLIRSTLWGCALYAAALVAFLHCSEDPLISDHPIRHLPATAALLLAFTMSLHAATTDVATRGFVLLALAEHTPVPFAIAMQNLAWFLGHVYEVDLFTRCLGRAAAVGLFLALGVLGDVVVLRTRNVSGLALAHVALNLVMAAYIRAL